MTPSIWTVLGWRDLLTAGRQNPRRVVWAGFGALVFAGVMAAIVVALPPVPALETEFGSPAARMPAYYRERAKAGCGQRQVKLVSQGDAWQRCAGNKTTAQAAAGDVC